MSLILEALRKSEAERRRGQTPDLHAELPPAARPARPGTLPWPWLLLAAATALGMSGWAARGYWLATPAAAAAVTGATIDPAPAASPAPVEWKPAARTVRPVVPAPQPQQAPALAPVARAPAVVPPAPAIETAPQASAPPVAATREPAAPAALPPPPSELPPAPAPIASAGSAVLRLSDLSAADRQQLPPLKMSMHMWGQSAPQRFAIIDGSRVSEGDRLGPAVVDEISADGVLLSWNGLHLKLPVR